jgi:hypothetical protein
MSLPWLDLQLQRQVRGRPLLRDWGGTAAERRQELSGARNRRPDFRVSRRSGTRRKPAPATLGSSQRKDYKTRRLNREVACHYTFMHENLFDMNHQFMHRKQMGSIRARCLGRNHGENWAQVEYSFARTGGRQSVGEHLIVDLMRNAASRRRTSAITCKSAPTTPRRV